MHGEAAHTETPVALTIAGSDSGGGAGIQADLKSFSALGVYGCSVITALTAQNSCAVTGVLGVEPAFIRQQMDAVFSDISVNAVKIGMLADSAVIEAVRGGLLAHKQDHDGQNHDGQGHIVLDPVMVAKSGDALLASDAVQTLRERLVPLATIITPNLPEAACLLGLSSPPADRPGMEAVAHSLHALGPSAVLLKGGHLDGPESADLYLDAGGIHWLEGVRIPTRNTHGTGCTLSAAIAAGLARKMPLEQAVRRAKDYIAGAIAAADRLQIGQGHGPVHHFYRMWGEEGEACISHTARGV